MPSRNFIILIFLIGLSLRFTTSFHKKSTLLQSSTRSTALHASFIPKASSNQIRQTVVPKQLIGLERISKSKLGEELVQAGYYICQGPSYQVSQGRSEILDSLKVVKVEGNGDVIVEPLKVKIVRDKDRFRREQENYKKIVGNSGSRNDVFVNIDRFEGSNGVIIMESGEVDLKQLSAKLGPIRGKALKVLASTMAKALNMVHAKGLVWTDLKLENFVLTSPRARTYTYTYPPSPPTSSSSSLSSSLSSSSSSSSFRLQKDLLQQRLVSKDIICKAIDLESAVVKNQNLIDFSPETAAPELCEILSNGQLSVGGRGRGKSDFTLGLTEPLIATQALDVWALGISILHLYLGKAPVVDRPDPRQSCIKLARYTSGSDDLGLGEVAKDDVWLHRLLLSMLRPQPRERCSLSAALKSIYFTIP